MKQSLPPRAILPVMPVVLVVSACQGEVNIATHGQVCTLSSSPPSMGISVLKGHKTAALIRQSGRFSINVPSTGLLDRVLLCGSRSGNQLDKSALFALIESEGGIPVIDECPVSLVCSLSQTVELDDSFFFIGEVTEALADSDCLAGDTPDALLCRTLLCSLDGRFFPLGQPLQAAQPT